MEEEEDDDDDGKVDTEEEQEENDDNDRSSAEEEEEEDVNGNERKQQTVNAKEEEEDDDANQSSSSEKEKCELQHVATVHCSWGRTCGRFEFISIWWKKDHMSLRFVSFRFYSVGRHHSPRQTSSDSTHFVRL